MTQRLLKENRGKTFSDINRTNVSLSQSLKAIEIKAKNTKWDIIKLITFGTVKKTINKMKRQLTEWEKTFANDGTNNRVISRIYKQLIQLNIKETIQARKKKRKKRQSI